MVNILILKGKYKISILKGSYIMKLDKNFYLRDTLTVAKELLGKKLVHKYRDKVLSGIIVETEAYCGPYDKAAHSYGSRKTERTKIMYKSGGISYIYFIYGLYYCFNVVTEKEDIPQAVLIRALQPIDGISEMSDFRYQKDYNNLDKKQIINLTNGPSKLCKAMMLDKSLNGQDLTCDVIYIEDIGYDDIDIISTTRIGIDYA